MNLQDSGVIIAKKALKENAFIISVFTANHGIYSGVVSRIAKKSTPYYQVGNLVDFSWQARLHEHIGLARCELIKSYGSMIINNKLKLYAFNSLLSLVNIAFLEREPHNNFFPYFRDYLERLVRGFYLEDYINIELMLINEAGYKLDFTACAVTGQSHDLHYLSPKSGRAVSKEAGQPYADRLLALPNFLKKEVNGGEVTKQEATQGFSITSYFLSRYLFNNSQPEARKSFLEVVLG